MSETLLGTKISAAVAARSLSGKYLTFTPQGESYGTEVLKVREIIRQSAITAVPRMPAFIRHHQRLP